MKKLMIAAAAAAMVGGAFASLCQDDVISATPKCWAWTFRANVKTLIPAEVKVAKVNPSGGTICADDFGGSAATNCTYLVAGIRQFTGVIWECESTCPAGDLALGNGAQYVIWENSSKYPVSAPLKMKQEEDTSVTPTRKYWSYTGTAWPTADGVATLFDRFGLYATAAEMYYALSLPGFSNLPATYSAYAETFKGTLTIAGFGALPSQKPAANFQTINGYCVANWQPECGPTKKDFCTALASWCAEADATNVAGYGVWSLSYNEALSSGRYSLADAVPARAIVREN